MTSSMWVSMGHWERAYHALLPAHRLMPSNASTVRPGAEVIAAPGRTVQGSRDTGLCDAGDIDVSPPQSPQRRRGAVSMSADQHIDNLDGAPARSSSRQAANTIRVRRAELVGPPR